MRTEKQINQEIAKLSAIAAKPTFRKRTFFGDSNTDAISAQIETLKCRYSIDTVDNREGGEWTEHEAASARQAAHWMAGEVDEAPSDEWKELY